MIGLIFYLLALMCSLALGVVIGATIVRDFIERDTTPRQPQLPVARVVRDPLALPAVWRR